MKSYWTSIGRIAVEGRHSGTGFLVAGNYVLTALHVVGDRRGSPYPRIRVAFFEAGRKVCDTSAQVTERFSSLEHDFALLVCDELPRDAKPLVLGDQYRQFRDCSSPGYGVTSLAGVEVLGQIVSLNEPDSGGLAPALGLQLAPGIPMRGHSGAPVVANGAVVGLLRSAFLAEDEKTGSRIVRATPIQRVVDHCNKITPGLFSYRSDVAWPNPQTGYSMKIADRKAELSAFEQIITGRVSQRVLLLLGASGYSKSNIVSELMAYARLLGVKNALIDLRLGPSLNDIFRSLKTDLPGVFQHTEATSGHAWMNEMLDELAFLDTPLVLAFDTWEAASTETVRWIEQRFLFDLDRMPGLVVIIAGQTIPNWELAAWKNLVMVRTLEAPISVEDWVEYAGRRWPNSGITADHVEAVTLIGDGRPSIVDRQLYQLAAAMVSRPAIPQYDRQGYESAAVPRWFDDNVLTSLLDLDRRRATSLCKRLAMLPTVDSVSPKRWSIHEATRRALRRKLQDDDPGRFRELSSRMARHFSNDDAPSQIETLYHLLSAEPEQGAERLHKTYWKWFRQGRQEDVQALGVALEELSQLQLPNPCKGQIQLIRGWIDFYRIPLTRLEELAGEAYTLLAESDAKVAFASAHSLVGDVMNRRGDLSGALVKYRGGLQLRTELLIANPNDVELARDLSASHHRVGGVLQQLGDLEEARREFEAAKSIRLALVQSDPENPAWQRDLSTSHNMLGGVFVARGQLTEALEEYHAFHNTMAGLVVGQPDNLAWQQEFATAKLNIGAVLQEQANLEEALAEFRACLEIRRKLCARDPSNLDWLRDLAVAHNRVGSVHQAREEHAQAFEEYQQYHRMMKELTVRDPESLGWQRELSISYSNLGRVLEMQGKREESLLKYEESLRIRLEMTKRSPSHAGWRRDLMRARNNVGRLLSTLDRLPEALAQHKAALGSGEALVQLDPNSRTWTADLASTQGFISEIQRRLRRRG